jgi:hypothetical protein
MADLRFTFGSERFEYLGGCDATRLTTLEEQVRLPPPTPAQEVPRLPHYLCSAKCASAADGASAFLRLTVALVISGLAQKPTLRTQAKVT